MKPYITTLCIIGLVSIFSCSNDDVPDPVDCNASTLTIALLAKGDVSGCGVSDGSISVTVSGGTPTYSLNINGGVNSSSTVFTALPAGSHTITVKDADGCERSLTVGVTDPGAGFTASTVIVDDNECLTDNGSVTVNVTGGTPPILYKFGSGAFGEINTFTGLKNGSYTVEVKDADDCPQVINAVVPRGDTGISFENDIKPILQTNCIKSGCHNGDNGATINWSVFANVKAKALNIKALTGDGTMPQDQVSTGGLPQSQRDLIACWVDDGAKEN